MSSTFPPWVLKAANLPVAFAQVREDPLIDLWVARQLSGDARMVLIASGGCTATFLVAAPKVTWLHLVDPNPAQLALSRLKLRLLQTSAPADRLALLGHASLPAAERQTRLEAELSALSLPPDVFGPATFVAEVGADYAGRYECVFAELRKALDDQADAIAAVLRLTDPAEQERRVSPGSP